MRERGCFQGGLPRCSGFGVARRIETQSETTRGPSPSADKMGCCSLSGTKWAAVLQPDLIFSHLARTSLFHKPFIWECVLQVALLRSPNPGLMWCRPLNIFVAELNVTYYGYCWPIIWEILFCLFALLPG